MRRYPENPYCTGQVIDLEANSLANEERDVSYSLPRYLVKRPISNDNGLYRLRSKRTIEMLPTEARVYLGLSRTAVDPELHNKFSQVEEGPAAGYLLADVILLEPLIVSIDGSERAKLNECHCGILHLNRAARSLNHAFTLLSEHFETDRLSHTGNVFRQGFTKQNGHWVCLDDLRLVRVMKALHERSSGTGSKDSLTLTGQG